MRDITKGETGLGPCKAIDQATERYELKNNMLKSFVNECVEINPGSKVGARELYDHYKLWAGTKSGNNNTRIISEVDFSKRMENLGLTKDRLKHNKVYVDIKLKNDGGGCNF